MTTKQCKKCGEVKNLSDDFYKSNKGTCKECVKTRARRNRSENIEKARAYDNRGLSQ